MKRKIIFSDGRKITYVIERKNVKNMNTRILFDNTVHVSANYDVLDSTIEKFIISKADLIFSTFEKYAEMNKTSNKKHRYITGESFRYLGNDLKLVVVKRSKNKVSSNDKENLILNVTDPDNTEQKKKLINKWFEKQCKIISQEITEQIHSKLKRYNIPMPKVTLRKMTSRWGSCHPKKTKITLNKRLIEAPRTCFEFIVMHEFVHFVYPNHSQEFYKMLSKFMPDWKVRKKALEGAVFLGGG